MICLYDMLFPFLQTIELLFVVIAYNCLQCYANNCVQLFTMSCVFSMIFQSYITHGQGVARHHCNCLYYIVILRGVFQGAIRILIGSTKAQLDIFVNCFHIIIVTVNYQVNLS